MLASAGCNRSEKDKPAATATPLLAPGEAAPTLPAGQSGNRYFPPTKTDEWETIEPAAAGFDAKKLQSVIDYIGEHDSTGAVILVGGRVVTEKYWQRTNAHTARDIASAQKSVLSVLVGIAQGEGRLKLDDYVSSFLGTGWSKAPAGHESLITIRHLLTMTSGLNDTLEPVGEPGKIWSYSNAFSQLHYVLEKCTGKTIQDYATGVLFGPTGIRDSSYYVRPAILNDPAAAGYGLRMSPRDMARFGLLMLNNGDWGAVPVVRDKAYLAESINSSQKLNLSYGYLWWLNGKQSFLYPTQIRPAPGPLVPSAPSDWYAALGRDDKKIHVVPSMDLVLSRWGGAADGANGNGRLNVPVTFDNEIWKRLTAARL